MKIYLFTDLIEITLILTHILNFSDQGTGPEVGTFLNTWAIKSGVWYRGFLPKDSNCFTMDDFLKYYVKNWRRKQKTLERLEKTAEEAAVVSLD